MRGGAGDREASVETESTLISGDEIVGSEMHDVVSTTLGAGAVSAGVKVGAGGRDVVEPYLYRGEVGSFGLYEANWGGARRWVSPHNQMEKDLIAEGPFQVITAQEADAVFAAKLAASDVGGGWMLVTGNEEGNTLLIGARASLVKEVKMLEWHRLVDGEYRVKKKNREAAKASAYSRVMLAEVVWKHSMASKESHLFLTCHMHHHTAKKAKGFADGFDRFWNTVEGILQRHDVDFITGDFNMSLWQVCPQLRIQHPATTVLAWYGWKTAAGGAYASAWKADCEDSEVGETAPVVAGIVQQSRHAASHRSDSYGIFSLRKPETVKRAMPDDAFENPHAQLDEWVARQGFAIDSFMGGRDAVKLSLEEAPSGDAGMLPTKEKLTHR